MEDNNQPGWVFKPGQEQSQAPQQTADQPPNDQQMQQPSGQQQTQANNNTGKITWTASEFIDHHKTGLWYVGFLGASALAIAIIYFITRDIFSVVILGIFAIVFAAFAARKPRTLQYSLTSNGISIGERHYNFGQFKSFSVIDEGSIRSISLVPLKRFMPTLEIYFAPEDEEKITNFLAEHLPYQERKQDPVDRLMRQIRF